MAYNLNDPSAYINYRPKVPQQAQDLDSSLIGGGSQGGSMALPYVGAGLQAAGLAANIYGAYKSNQIAERNYEDQKREFERQRAMQAEALKRQIGQQNLENIYAAANKSQSDEDHLMSKYAGYYKGIGL